MFPHYLDLPSFWTITILIFVAVAVKTILLRSTKLPYPPGPKPLPIIGNLFQIPVSWPWIEYAKWGKVYNSDLVYARAFGQRILVVNSIRAANDLLERRNFADRPYLPLLTLMGWDYNIAFLQYSDEWRKHRRALQEAFRPVAVAKYRNTQLVKAHDLLRSLLSDPEGFISHIRTVATAVTVATIYGYDIESIDDHFVQIAEKAVENLAKSMLPSAAVVNVFPILRYIPSWCPGGAFHHYARENKELLNAIIDEPYKLVRKKMAAGEARPSILSTLLENNDADGALAEQEDLIKKICAAAYTAGADTTVSSIGTFFLAMVLNQEAQHKAQEELDRVIGTRFPNYEDRKSLPYLDALYREVMRWNTVSPLGVPHATLEDDVVTNASGESFFIPKGTMVLSNIWAMSHDEAVYPQPHLFKPERFLAEDGKLKDDSTVYAYGFGRRICAGRYMAEETIWLVAASVLSMFNLRKAKDGEGNEIEVLGLFTDATVSHAVPYRCSITPRSRETARLVKEEGLREL